MSDNLPLVSIVTPVYNGARFLDDLILSVKNQDYPSFEHIIVDDGSKDDGATVEVLKKYPHLNWWTRPNKGQYSTMNDGLAAAKGDFVCFVSADDVLLPGAIKTAMEFLSKHPSYHGVFGRTAYMDETGKRVATDAMFRDFPFSQVEYLAHVPHCSFYIRKSALDEFGLGFDPSLFYVGDYEWMIRISRRRLKIGHIPDELSMIRYHEGQATQRFGDKSLKELEVVYKTHRVNRFYRNLALWLHFYYFRIWEMRQIYKNTGIKGLQNHFGNFLRKHSR